jgi:hypothetical protein
MWVVGAVIGRWWAVPLGAVLWLVLVVLAVHVIAGDLVLVAALGGANTAVGVGLRSVSRLLLRGGRSVLTQLSRP